MTGHRFRTESLAKDVGSEVTDWAETGVSLVACSAVVIVEARVLTGLGVVLHGEVAL